MSKISNKTGVMKGHRTFLTEVSITLNVDKTLILVNIRYSNSQLKDTSVLVKLSVLQVQQSQLDESINMSLCPYPLCRYSTHKIANNTFFENKISLLDDFV